MSSTPATCQVRQACIQLALKRTSGLLPGCGPLPGGGVRPLRDVDRLPVGHLIEQQSGVLLFQQQGSMFGAEESLVHHEVEERGELREEAERVEQPDRLLVNAE